MSSGFRVLNMCEPSGAALAAVAAKLPEIARGSRILTFNYDTGERYLSVEALFG